MYQHLKFKFGSRDLEVRTMFDEIAQEWVFAIFEAGTKLTATFPGVSAEVVSDARVLRKLDPVVEAQKWVAERIVSGNTSI
jgi:hypothetical protein